MGLWTWLAGSFYKQYQVSSQTQPRQPEKTGDSLLPIRLPKLQSLTMSSVGEAVVKQTLSNMLMGKRWKRPRGKAIRQCLPLKNAHTLQTPVPLFHIYPKEPLPHIFREAYTRIFCEALFVIVERQKQPLAERESSKLCNTHNMQEEIKQNEWYQYIVPWKP